MLFSFVKLENVVLCSAWTWEILVESSSLVKPSPRDPSSTKCLVKMVSRNLPSIRTIKASFRIASVVPRTISENTNVQTGSAIAQDG